MSYGRTSSLFISFSELNIYFESFVVIGYLKMVDTVYTFFDLDLSVGESIVCRMVI